MPPLGPDEVKSDQILSSAFSPLIAVFDEKESRIGDPV
jgi:hypothetical protein